MVVNNKGTLYSAFSTISTMCFTNYMYMYTGLVSLLHKNK